MANLDLANSMLKQGLQKPMGAPGAALAPSPDEMTGPPDAETGPGEAGGEQGLVDLIASIVMSILSGDGAGPGGTETDGQPTPPVAPPGANTAPPARLPKPAGGILPK